MSLKGYYPLINYNLLEWDLILFDIFISFIYNKVKVKIESIIYYMELAIGHCTLNYYIAKEPIISIIIKVILNRGVWIYAYSEGKLEILYYLYIVYIDYLSSCILVDIIVLYILICLIYAMN